MSGVFTDDAGTTLAARCRCVPHLRIASSKIGNGGAAGAITLTSFRPNRAIAQSNGRAS